MSQYYIQLENITINKFRNLLQKAELLPSQQILKDGLDASFNAIEKEGIKNLDQLQSLLKTKAGLAKLAGKTGITEEFLTVLRREVNGYVSKKRKINEFPTLDEQFINQLEAMNIKDTQQYFNEVFTAADRTALADKIGVGMEPVLELTRLVDVSRLRYVNQAFATLLVKAGYDCVEKVSRADPDKLYKDIKKANEENRYYRGAIGLKDIKYLINDAKELPRARVEY
ncbi:MAG: DUF4332 domain-containing protein [Syntrophomonadaceae bacterium]